MNANNHSIMEDLFLPRRCHVRRQHPRSTMR
jgi:hypothetical protein